MKSNAELAPLAQKYGWRVGPLSFAQVRAMSSNEFRWHELNNSKALQSALDEKNSEGTTEKAEAISKWRMIGRAYQTGLYMDSETLELFAQVAAEFERRHPEISPELENGAILGQHMIENHLDPTKLESFETAYRQLGGKSAFRLSAQAQKAEDEKRMGAAEYGRKHGIVGGDARQRDFRATDDSRFYNPLTRQVETRVRASPQMLAARDRNIASFVEQTPDYAQTNNNKTLMFADLLDRKVDWTVQQLAESWRRVKATGEADIVPPEQQSQHSGQVVVGTDMQGQHSGTDHIPFTDKHSFHTLVRNMDSKTFAERCRTDRQFREAVDKWGER